MLLVPCCTSLQRDTCLEPFGLKLAWISATANSKSVTSEEHSKRHNWNQVGWTIFWTIWSKANSIFSLDIWHWTHLHVCWLNPLLWLAYSGWLWTASRFKPSRETVLGAAWAKEQGVIFIWMHHERNRNGSMQAPQPRRGDEVCRDGFVFCQRALGCRTLGTEDVVGFISGKEWDGYCATNCTK